MVLNAKLARHQVIIVWFVNHNLLDLQPHNVTVNQDILRILPRNVRFVLQIARHVIKQKIIVLHASQIELIKNAFVKMVIMRQIYHFVRHAVINVQLVNKIH